MPNAAFHKLKGGISLIVWLLCDDWESCDDLEKREETVCSSLLTFPFSLSSSKPGLGVKLRRTAPQLELKDAFRAERAYGLSGAYLLSAAYADGAEVAVDGDVVAVAHHYDDASVEVEHRAYLAVEHRAYRCAWLPLDVDALVVEPYVPKPGHVLLAEVAHYAARPGQRHWQAAPVALEAAA